MRKLKCIAGVAAVLMGALSPAFFIEPDTVCCEKVYDVKLSAETVEIDINDIPENREVQVGISIDNNPGFVVLHFFVELDERMKSKNYPSFEFDYNEFAINSGFYKNETIIDIGMTNCYVGNPFYDNSNLLYLNLILPEDVKPGDFFSVKPFYFYQDENKTSEAYFRQENTFESYFNYENFAESNAGGIRITGQKVQEPQQPAPQLEPTPAPQEEHHEAPQNSHSDNNSSSDNRSENKQQAQNIVTSASASEAATSVTAVSSTVSETVTESVPETSVTAISSTEALTSYETDVSETVTEIVSDKPEVKEKKTVLPYIAAVIVAAAGAAVSGAIRKNKKREK